MPQPVIELDRIETPAYVEVLWSNGQKVRLFTFANRNLAPGQRAERRRRLRAARIARRAGGERRKALLAQHGVDPAGIRSRWQPSLKRTQAA